MINFKLSEKNSILSDSLNIFSLWSVLDGYFNNVVESIILDHKEHGVNDLDTTHLLGAIKESKQYDRECKDVILFLIECEKMFDGDSSILYEIDHNEFGHYLWHTRNYSGVEFWSHYDDELGDRLTRLCHSLLTTSEVCLGIKEDQEEPRNGNSIYIIDFIH